FNPWWPTYSDEINWGKRWSRERRTFFYKHLAEFFGLNAPVELTVNKDADDNSRKLVINDVALTGNKFTGKFFPGRRLVVKSLSEGDGLYVNGWEVAIKDASGLTTQTYDTETLNIDMPEGSKVEITPVLDTEPTAVEGVLADIDASKPCELYDLSGRSLGTVASPDELPQLTPGIYILRQGAATRKVVVK
ncbi:MAG: T9SS type A sorting domain-containing protein, partial [Muribaculaceae bacterium]|nr:T9SS type A sorting domain-containing protein [Muribaculaceae bacterium]